LYKVRLLACLVHDVVAADQATKVVWAVDAAGSTGVLARRAASGHSIIVSTLLTDDWSRIDASCSRSHSSANTFEVKDNDVRKK
jgi:hypothetical protein